MNKKIKICFIATEMAGFDHYGGFGCLTRNIAEGLAAQDMEVYVAMPRKINQRPVEIIDHITVVSYPSPLYVGLKRVLPFAGLYKMIDADIYHSEEPSLGTCLAQMGAPHKKHVVTFQDPRTIEDWRYQWAPRQLSRYRFLRRFREWKFQMRYQLDVGRAVRKSDVCFCQANYIIDKAIQLYRLDKPPSFLPNPVVVPNTETMKAPEPTVCFLGRWDSIKRPELFINLATKFPHVRFIAMGACPNNPERDRQIRSQCEQLCNVEAPGWLGLRDKYQVLSRSWIMVNTSTKECLPLSYLEACAHKCAILSHGNADNFASKFGYWSKTGDLEDFTRGLYFLLEGNQWRQLGENGYEYVKNTHEFNKVIYQHLKIYREMLGL
jgi:glycosyltransferase involved in cell wall biosynthesis